MASIAMMSTISPKSGEFASFLRRTAESTASGKHTISWYGLVDAGGTVPKGFTILCSEKPTKSSPYNHAKLVFNGIELLKKNKPDYVVICDADVAILSKGWDKKIVKKLKSFDVVGVNVGSSLPPKRYQRFPILTFMAFKSNLLSELDWDLYPQKRGSLTGPHKIYSANKYDARICGVPLGTTIKKDAGWKIPYFFAEKGYDNPLVLKECLVGSKCCKMPYPKKRDKKTCLSMKSPHQMGEYSFPDGELFCTHMYISRRESFVSPKVKIWRRRIVSYFDSTGVNLI